MPVAFGRATRAPGVPAGVAVAPPPTLPPLDPMRGGVIVEAPAVVPPELAPAGGMGASAKRITVTAVDADARTLLISIAREAGINMVVSNDVRSRVSVSFADVAADVALRSIIAQAGLTVVEAPSTRSMPVVVYYQLPVNVNDAPVETISARFGVSADLARWLAENRGVAPRQDKQQR